MRILPSTCQLGKPYPNLSLTNTYPERGGPMRPSRTLDGANGQPVHVTVSLGGRWTLDGGKTEILTLEEYTLSGAAEGPLAIHIWATQSPYSVPGNWSGIVSPC